MQCENCFCVYWKDNRCIVDEIYLDIMGCCQTCIYVDIPEDILREKREMFLEQCQE